MRGGAAGPAWDKRCRSLAPWLRTTRPLSNADGQWFWQRFWHCPPPAPSDHACLPAPLHLPASSQREWNRNRRSPSPPPLEGVRDLREMLSRRQSGGSAVAAAAAAAADVSRGRELPPGLGALPGERWEREREAERRASGGAPQPRQEERVLTLDELFKKTNCKPCIYWLPLTGGAWCRHGAQLARDRPQAS